MFVQHPRPRTLCAPIYSHKNATLEPASFGHAHYDWRRLRWRSATADAHVTTPVGSSKRSTTRGLILTKRYFNFTYCEEATFATWENERSDEESVHFGGREESRARELALANLHRCSFVRVCSMFWVDMSRLESCLFCFCYFATLIHSSASLHRCSLCRFRRGAFKRFTRFVGV